ncbi:MAG: hypothetical protein ACI828_002888 [Flavobacteriales bacterium]|jgi:hypothetical protein
MHREIIVSAFAKAKKEELKEHGIQASTNRAAERISAYISDHSKVPFGAKSLRMLHTKTKNAQEIVEIKQPQVVGALCNYLGFDTYEAYAVSKGDGVDMPDSAENHKESMTFLARHKWPLSIIFFIVAGSGIYFMTNKQRWMIWDETHYIEVPFDAETLQNGQLKLLKKDRVKNFVKVRLSCDSVFFNPDGSAKFWYGKNRNKELEFFTDLAKHPETGKALKPLSAYMIDKYICLK